MIKIEKDILAIPISLTLPLPDSFLGRIPRPSKTTHDRRMEVIANNGYIEAARYNDRYKQKDITDALKNIYNKKCAFCEQRIEHSHVEHYRPKNKYYWLAFSWDNLILACPTCNQHKGTNFEIRRTAIIFNNTDDNLLNIHISSSNYDLIEQPKMINPEVSDPSGKLIFYKNGNVESNDENFAYTIEKCRINRADLNDQRRTILNNFRNDIRSVLLEFTDLNEQKIGVQTIVSKFVRDSIDPISPFLAFKKFIIDNRWLSDIIKEIN